MPIPTNQNLYNKILEKIKNRVRVWPSAHASGAVVKEYKAEMKKQGKKPYIGAKPQNSGLAIWFRKKN